MPGFRGAPATVGSMVLAAALLGGCGTGDTTYPRSADQRGGATAAPRTTVTGDQGLILLGPGSVLETPGPAETGGGVGVNALLWRASLDTIAFLPLASADPFGGVIITDWHSPPDVVGERVKVHVYILSRDLRADGLRVAVFRQRDNGKGQWVTAAVDDRTAAELESAILFRARQFRVAGIE